MFVIVPSARAATNASDADIRGPTRTQNACNSCRLRKAKCNGSQPCSRCRTRDLVCVYSRSGKDVPRPPLNPEQAILLRRENQRLERALRRMAGRIEALESMAREGEASDRPAAEQSEPRVSADASTSTSAININDILSKYAPEEYSSLEADSPLAGEEPSNSHDLPAAAVQDAGSKKRRVGERGDHHQQGAQMAPDQMGLPFAIAPGPNYQQMASAFGGQHMGLGNSNGTGNTTTTESGPLQARSPATQAFETLLQMSQLRREQQPSMPNQAVPPPPPHATAPSSNGALPDFERPLAAFEGSEMQPANTTAQELLPESFLDLIDWDESLQNWYPSGMDWQ
ncbi:hypothetical protein KC316_g1389 [Hortaea werneckii]|nr:hypothetical protein KC324_g1072 [Hortaea werneckii]KAI7594015.1 hypothetical protein KC316_g1389 [Hortaea werneckii]